MPRRLLKELTNLLHQGTVEVTFTKLDGERRILTGTLKEDLLPIREVSDKEVNRNRAVNNEVQVVYDLEKKEFRSFRKDSVIAYRVI